MDFEHGALVWFSKSFGLFYLIGLSLIVVVYAYWPSNKKKFDHAAKAILDDGDDRPDRRAAGQDHGHGDRSSTGN